MAQVTFTLNQVPYTMACDDGQEEWIARLAASIDERIRETADQVGEVGDLHLMVMVAIMMADEIAMLQSRPAGSGEQAEGSAPDPDARLAAWMEQFSVRLENLVQNLEARQ